MAEQDIRFTVRMDAGQAEAAQKQLESGFQKVGKATEQFNATMNRARIANTNFNRVIQDSPYFFQSFNMGVIAIGNNIDPLIASLKTLKDETGSWGGALKKFAESFTGGGGFLSVVSLAVAGFTAFSLATRESKEETKRHTDALAKEKEELDKLKTRLKEFNVTRTESFEITKRLREEEQKRVALAWSQDSGFKKGADSFSGVMKSINDGLQAEIDKFVGNPFTNRLDKIINEGFKLNGKDLDKYIKGLGITGTQLKNLTTALQDETNSLKVGTKEYDERTKALEKWEKAVNRVTGKDKSGEKSYKKLMSAYISELGKTEIPGFNFTDDKQEKFLKVQADFIEKVKDQFERNGLKWDAGAREYAYQLSMSLLAKPIENKDMSFIKAFEQANPWTGVDGLSGSFADNIENLRNQVIKDNPVFKEISDSFGSTFADAGMEAFEKIFGEANSLLEKFLANFANGLLNVAANNLSKNVFGELLKLLPGGSILSSLFGSGTAPITNKIILDGKVIAEQTVTPSTVNKALNQTQRLRLEY